MITDARHFFRYVMAALTVIFVVVALLFCLVPEFILQIANTLGAFFHLRPAQAADHRFWVAMTVSMMATISVCTFLMYQNPDRHHNLVWPLLTAKITSSLMGLGYFLFYSQVFAHLLIPITDAPIAVLVILVYRAAFPQDVLKNNN